MSGDVPINEETKKAIRDGRFEYMSELIRRGASIYCRVEGMPDRPYLGRAFASPEDEAGSQWSKLAVPDRSCSDHAVIGHWVRVLGRTHETRSERIDRGVVFLQVEHRQSACPTCATEREEQIVTEWCEAALAIQPSSCQCHWWALRTYPTDPDCVPYYISDPRYVDPVDGTAMRDTVRCMIRRGCALDAWLDRYRRWMEAEHTAWHNEYLRRQERERREREQLHQVIRSAWPTTDMVLEDTGRPDEQAVEMERDYWAQATIRPDGTIEIMGKWMDSDDSLEVDIITRDAFFLQSDGTATAIHGSGSVIIYPDGKIEFKIEDWYQVL